MSDLYKPADFDGVLRHVERQGDVVTLRLHPFEFTNDPSANVVFQVDLRYPQFDLNTVDPFIGREVEIEIDDHVVKMVADLEGDEIFLTADSIEAFNTTYTIKEFVDHVSEITTAFNREFLEYNKVRRKLDSLNSLAVELRRRAVIKSEASEHHSKHQRAAIKVLDRIMATLKSNNE